MRAGDQAVRVTHFAKSHRNIAATSFSHPFYLVMKEKAKKVGKSCHLGVIRHPPWFCTRATTEIRLLKKKLKFEPFSVFLHAQTPFQSIRHEKLHKNRYQERPKREVELIAEWFQVAIHFVS